MATPFESSSSSKAYCYMMVHNEEWPHLEVAGGERRNLGGGKRKKGPQARFTVQGGVFSDNAQSFVKSKDAENPEDQYTCYGEELTWTMVGDVSKSWEEDDEGRRRLHGGRLLGGKSKFSIGMQFTQNPAAEDMTITVECRAPVRQNPENEEETECIAMELICRGTYQYESNADEAENPTDGDFQMVCKTESWEKRPFQSPPSCPSESDMFATIELA